MDNPAHSPLDNLVYDEPHQLHWDLVHFILLLLYHSKSISPL